MTLLNNTTTNNCQVTSHNVVNANHVTLRASNLTERAVDYHLISNTQSIIYSRRPYLCASSKLRGGITLEAAIALPTFLLFFLALISVINIMYIQLTVQIQLEETARQLSKTAYASISFYSLSDDAQDEAAKENHSLIEKLGGTIASISIIQNSFLDDNMKTFLDDSQVVGGANGISFLSSSLDIDSGIVDIVATYTASILFIPEDIFSLNLANRCYLHLYVGRDLETEQTPDEIYLYYTSYGRVFHINKYCRYLLNYSNVSPFNSVNLSIYQPCTLCVVDDYDILKRRNPTVYTSEKGYAYHTSLDCPSFTGNIYRAKYTSLDDSNQICEECLKGK